MRLGGWRKFDLWLESEPPQAEIEAAHEALFAITDGSYELTHSWYPDPTSGIIRHVMFGTHSNVISWRVTPDYPDTVQVIYVGPVEFF